MRRDASAGDAVTPAGTGPRHVAIIMDGNGRWAERLGRRRIVGHRLGARAVRRTTEAAVRLGLEQLTLYTFSVNNWRRSRDEVAYLMRLFGRFLRAERRALREQGVRLQAIGRTGQLPPAVARALHESIEATRRGDTMTLCLAINYGGRAELVDACRRLARSCVRGSMAPDRIDAETLAASLYQPDMPPLDLIIRTGGEMRLSDFLLWQAAYAEIWTTPVCWPEFSEEHLRAALSDFARRERRFGAAPVPVL